MEQRQVRLGDILDDYCPRERRVTNHAVVALVGDEVKLTRCTTCDTEHQYKAARVPPRRQTKLVAALSSPGDAGAGPALQGLVDAAPVPQDVTVPAPPTVEPAPPSLVDSVRRPLIRATLERPEGAPPPVRQAPVFTVREAGRDGGVDRGGKARRQRRNGGRPHGQPNGNRADGHDAQAGSSSHGKNGSRPQRTRSANRSSTPGRSAQSGNGQPRNRGKGRPR